MNNNLTFKWLTPILIGIIATMFSLMAVSLNQRIENQGDAVALLREDRARIIVFLETMDKRLANIEKKLP